MDRCIQDVLTRVIEQFSKLKKYLLEVLPEQKRFKGKSSIGSSKRYIYIKTSLANKKLPSIIAAVIFITKDFKKFTVPLHDS